ncbi:hypothetical protein CLOM_g1479 [Closterium sp. NIES-68]|nr:hypothetical protein CLOM_g1479 [Closterium sp. NIES-68]
MAPILHRHRNQHASQRRWPHALASRRPPPSPLTTKWTRKHPMPRSTKVMPPARNPLLHRSPSLLFHLHVLSCALP